MKEDIGINESTNDQASGLGTPVNYAGIPWVVYYLFGAGFFAGLPFLAGLVLAYVAVNEYDTPVLRGHWRWQVRTFWFSALYSVLAVVTAPLLIGYAIGFANVLWTLYRVILGLVRLNAGRSPYTNA